MKQELLTIYKMKVKAYKWQQSCQIEVRSISLKSVRQNHFVGFADNSAELNSGFHSMRVWVRIFAAGSRYHYMLMYEGCAGAVAEEAYSTTQDCDPAFVAKQIIEDWY